LVSLFFWRDTRSSFLIPKAVIAINLAIIGASVWLVLWSYGFLKLPHTKLTGPLFALLGVFLLSIPGCVSLPDAMEALSRVFAYVALFYLTVSVIRKGEQVRLIYLLLVFAGTTASCLAIMEYHGIRIWDWSEKVGRLSIISTFGNPNYLAGFLVAVIPLGLSMVLHKIKGFLLQPLNSGCLIMLSCVVITQTRGSWLALAVAIPALVILMLQSAVGQWFREHIGPLLAFMLIGFVLLTAVVVIFGPGELSVDRLFSGHNIIQRFLVWQVTLNMVRDYPLFGVGLGNFKVHYMQYQADFLEDPANKRYIPFNGKAVQSHNDYLQLLAETGLLGVLVLGWVLYRLMRIFLPLLSVQSPAGGETFYLAGAAASLIGVATHAVVSFPLHLPATSLVVCLVAGIAAGWGSRIFLGKGSTGSDTEDSYRSKPPFDGTQIIIIVFVSIVAVIGIFKINGTWVAYTFWKDGLGALGEKELSQQERYISAAELCARALKFAPNNGAIRANYADFIARSVEHLPLEDARPALEQAIREYEKSARNYMKRELYNDIGNVYMRLQDFENAEKAYKKGVRIDPTYNLVKKNLGNFYLKTQQYDKAEKYFSDALELYHKQPVVWLNVGLIRQQSGRLSEAAVAFQNASRLSPANPKPLYFLAQIEEGQGQFTAAAEHYRTSLIMSERRLTESGYDAEKDPLLMTIRHRMGVMLGRTNRLEESVEALKAARAMKPDNESILCDLGVALGQKGALTEAVTVFEEGLEYNPASSSLLLNLGIAYMRLMRFSRARRILERLIDSRPQSRSAATARQMLEDLDQTMEKKQTINLND
jgi:tetratricopeptide (TPR) repeat protein/O-antigen ligase